MSILIKGFEMPKSCIECPMQFGGMCYVQPAEIDEPRVADTPSDVKGRADWCPLIEVPPHGRLIDADALDYSLGVEDEDINFHFMLEDAPTIIEAEDET